MIILYILCALAAAAVVALAAAATETLFARRTGKRPADRSAGTDGRTAVQPPQECCGQHEVCEKDSLLAAVSKEIEYYDDEELDRFCGILPSAYTEQDTEEFREILYSMQDHEVAGWVRSLQLRGIPLPDTLKDEIYLIIGERRH